MAKKASRNLEVPPPPRNKDIPSEVAFPTLGSQDSAFGDTRAIDDTYDYTNQSLPGRIGGDFRLKKAQMEHQIHKDVWKGRR